MAGQVLLVVDNGQTGPVQVDQPSAHMGAWLLPIPDGSDGLTVAAEWAANQRFAIGSHAWVLNDASAMEQFEFQANWVPVAE